MMIGAMNDTRFANPTRAPAHIPCFIFSRSLSCHIYITSVFRYSDLICLFLHKECVLLVA